MWPGEDEASGARGGLRRSGIIAGPPGWQTILTDSKNNADHRREEGERL